MNHFTPRRLLGLNNLDDEQAFLAAQQEWEDALSAYREQLQRIRKKLPKGLRQLIESVYLHDAHVLAMHQDAQNLRITLQPQSGPQRLVVLGYDLVEEPIIQTDALPPEARSEPLDWLYDELALDRPEGPRGLPEPEGEPTFRHNILLSNGWEVILRFRSAWAKRPLPILPQRRPAEGA